MHDLNDVGNVVRWLNEEGEDLSVACNRQGYWLVQRGTQVALQSADGRDVLAFLYGIGSTFRKTE